MTDSARALWNDKNFLSLRIRQQQDHLIQLQKRCFIDNDISVLRYVELFDSGQQMMAIYVKRFMELQ